MTKHQVRCAIYTRKSSEEGLDQSFNSLEAQQETCRAYILSQKHEGWSEIKKHYDDGGFSGGTMERPALKRLLTDIQESQIDNVVVYKVDRLTRSLADFAKIIEILDGCKVSFVSVTQPFNTTTSMGRLTLNVLLSFAQFEREVTGERIRDKVAASKKKGMWMGGIVPLGYDCTKHRLITNQAEAQTVRTIFREYLRLGSVKKLKAFLDERNIISKRRKSGKGLSTGGVSFSRGALYHLLSNRIYLGEIVHRDQAYSGQHKGIVSRELWNRAAELLKENNQSDRAGKSHSTPSLLRGKLFDPRGVRFTPTHAVKKTKRYRYYTSQSAIQNATDKPAISRFPAYNIEKLVESQICLLLRSPEKCVAKVNDKACKEAATERARNMVIEWPKLGTSKRQEFVRSILKRVVLGRETVQIEIDEVKLLTILQAGSSDALQRLPLGKLSTLKLNSSFEVLRRGSKLCVINPDGVPSFDGRPAASLKKAVVRAHGWYGQIIRGERSGSRSIARTTGLDERYVNRILRCAFLAPDIVERILDGRQPPNMTLEEFRTPLPTEWTAQCRLLGFCSK
jgi:site-specific DNA recombinase